MAAQGLSAAKRRRAGGAGISSGEFGGNTKLSAQPAQSKTANPRRITTQDAIHLVNSKIMSVDKLLKANLKSIGEKLGEQETYMTENTPDLSLINNAFADINARLVQLETLGDRLSAVEAKLSIKSPASTKSPVTVKPTAETKPRRTDRRKKVTDPVAEDAPTKGISFSIGDD